MFWGFIFVCFFVFVFLGWVVCLFFVFLKAAGAIYTGWEERRAGRVLVSCHQGQSCHMSPVLVPMFKEALGTKINLAGSQRARDRPASCFGGEVEKNCDHLGVHLYFQS